MGIGVVKGLRRLISSYLERNSALARNLKRRRDHVLRHLIDRKQQSLVQIVRLRKASATYSRLQSLIKLMTFKTSRVMAALKARLSRTIVLLRRHVNLLNRAHAHIKKVASRNQHLLSALQKVEGESLKKQANSNYSGMILRHLRLIQVKLKCHHKMWVRSKARLREGLRVTAMKLRRSAQMIYYLETMIRKTHEACIEKMITVLRLRLHDNAKVADDTRVAIKVVRKNLLELSAKLKDEKRTWRVQAQKVKQAFSGMLAKIEAEKKRVSKPTAKAKRMMILEKLDMTRKRSADFRNERALTSELRNLKSKNAMEFRKMRSMWAGELQRVRVKQRRRLGKLVRTANQLARRLRQQPSSTSATLQHMVMAQLIRLRAERQHHAHEVQVIMKLMKKNVNVVREMKRKKKWFKHTKKSVRGAIREALKFRQREARKKEQYVSTLRRDARTDKRKFAQVRQREKHLLSTEKGRGMKELDSESWKVHKMHEMLKHIKFVVLELTGLRRVALKFRWLLREIRPSGHGLEQGHTEELTKLKNTEKELAELSSEAGRLRNIISMFGEKMERQREHWKLESRLGVLVRNANRLTKQLEHRQKGWGRVQKDLHDIATAVYYRRLHHMLQKVLERLSLEEKVMRLQRKGTIMEARRLRLGRKKMIKEVNGLLIRRLQVKKLSKRIRSLSGKLLAAKQRRAMLRRNEMHEKKLLLNEIHSVQLAKKELGRITKQQRGTREILKEVHNQSVLVHRENTNKKSWHKREVSTLNERRCRVKKLFGQLRKTQTQISQVKSTLRKKMIEASLTRTFHMKERQNRLLMKKLKVDTAESGRLAQKERVFRRRMAALISEERLLAEHIKRERVGNGLFTVDFQLVREFSEKADKLALLRATSAHLRRVLERARRTVDRLYATLDDQDDKGYQMQDRMRYELARTEMQLRKANRKLKNQFRKKRNLKKQLARLEVKLKLRGGLSHMLLGTNSPPSMRSQFVVSSILLFSVCALLCSCGVVMWRRSATRVQSTQLTASLLFNEDDSSRTEPCDNA